MALLSGRVGGSFPTWHTRLSGSRRSPELAASLKGKNNSLMGLEMPQDRKDSAFVFHATRQTHEVRMLEKGGLGGSQFLFLFYGV